MKSARRLAGINIKVVVILVLALAVVGGGVVGVHYVRKRSMANEALAKGKDALAQQKWEDAARHLKIYLSKYPQDEGVLAEYCDASLKTRPATPVSVMSAINGYRRLLLRFRPGNPEICDKLCKLYFHVGDFAELKYICEHWRSAHPEDRGASLWMAKALVGQNEHAKARAELASLVERDAKAEVEVYRLLSAAAMQLGTDEGREEARDWMNKCIEAHPDSPRARALRAQLHTVQRPIDEQEAATARADLEAAEALPAVDPVAMLMVSDIWLDLKEFERAKAALRKLDSADSSALESMDIDADEIALARTQGAAKIVLRRGGADVAEDLAEQSLADLKGDARDRFLSTAVRLFLLAGKTDRAKTILDEYAAALNRPGRSGSAIEEFALLQARIAAAENRPRDVLTALDTYVARGAADPSVYSVAAWAHQAIGHPNEARTLWEKYVHQVPDDSEALLSLAATYEGENWQQALHYARAAEDSAATPAARLARIEAQIMQAEGAPAEQDILESCRTELLRLREEQPRVAGVRVLLASVFHLMGRNQDAVAELEVGMADSSDPLLLHLALVDLHDRDGKRDSALKVCRAAITNFPDKAAPRTTLARLLRDAGRADDAGKSLDEACASLSGAEKSEAQEALVQHLLSVNRREEAFRLLQQMVEEHPDDVIVRCRLLSMPEARREEAFADRLLEEIRTIEERGAIAAGAARLWEVAQAKLWLDRGEWAAHGPEIERALGGYTAGDGIKTDWFWTAAVEGLVQYYTLRNEPQRVEDSLRAAFNRNPRSVTIADALLKHLERQAKFVEAEDVLDRMQGGGDRIEQHKVGLSLMRGRYTDAMADLQQKVAADPRDVASRALLASLVFNQGKDAVRALSLLDEAAKVSPDELELARLRVAILTASGDVKQGADFLNAEVARRGDFAIHWLRARYYDQMGNLAGAEQDYRKLATFADAGGAGHGLCGRFLARQHRTADAIRVWEEGLAKFPQNTDLHRVLISVLLAEPEPTARKRGEELLTELRTRAESDPKLAALLPEVQRFEAQLLAEVGGRDGAAQAETKLVEVVRKEPRDILAWRQLTMLARDAGDLEKAKTVVTQALAANPNHPDLTMMLASLEHELGNAAVARSLAQSVRETQPAHVESRLLLAQLLLGAGDVNAASTVLNEATVIAPGSESVQTARTTVMLAMGRVDDAIENLRSYMDEEGGSGSVEAALLLARLHVAKKDYQAADTRLKVAEKLAPADTRVILARIAWHAAQRQFGPIDALARAYPVDGKGYVEVVGGAAYVLAGSGEAPQARVAGALFELVSRNRPDHPAGHLGAARVHYQEGRTDEAVRTYRRVLELDEYQAEALNDLAWILAERGGEEAWKEADMLASRGVDSHPQDAHLRDTRGVVRFKLGRLDDAIQDLEHSASLAPTNSPTRAKALLHLSRVLVAKGDKTGARRRAEEAVKIDERIHCLSEDERGEVARLMGG